MISKTSPAPRRIDLKARRPRWKGKIQLILFAVGLPLLVLGVISLTSYQSIRDLQQRTQQVEHSQQVLLEVEELVSLYKSARAGARSFLIVGQPVQSQNFQAAAQAIPQKIAALQLLTADNPQQQQRIAQFASAISADLAAMQESIRKKTEGSTPKLEDLSARFAALSGNETLLEKLESHIDAEEGRLLVLRKAEAKRSLDRTVRAIIYGSLTGFALLACVLVLLREARLRKTAEDARRRSEERLRLMIEGVVDYAIYMLDPEGNVHSWNSGAELIHGYPADEIIGRNFSCFYTAQDIADGQPEQALREAAACGRLDQEGWQVCKDGSRFWASTLITAMRDSSGSLRGYSKISRNLSERKVAEEALHKAHHQLELRVQERTAELADANLALHAEIAERKQVEAKLRERAAQLAISEQRFSNIFHASPAPMIIFRCRDSVILDANPSCAGLVGYSTEEMIGRTPFEIGLLDAEQVGLVRERLAGQTSVRDLEIGLRTRSGRERVVLCSSETTELDGVECHLALIIDITERKEAEQRAHYIAHHDALTGLPNRLLMQDRLTQAIVHARRSARKMALLFVDLDHFKHINDSLGHMTGDRLLQMAAVRLQHCLRENDSVARLGGDEFVIILQAPTESGDVTTVSEKMLHALGLPFVVDGQELHVSGSIGISLYPADGTDADTLMRAADTAMYHAKEIGRGNSQFFMPTLNKAAQQRMSFVSRLHQALDRDEFTLHYQPQIDIGSGRIFAVEALLRWQQKGKEALSCSDFIAVAEETGMILPLGEWALRSACRQLRQWRAVGYPQLQIAVNLSARQLYQAQFEHLVERILEENGVPPAALELEITEGVLMRPSESNLSTLNRLSEMGVQLAVDDFGMGYSSLAYLRRFPINTLKIDRSFVSGIGQDPHDMAIVSAIIVMAQTLHLDIIAEGVENAEQEVFLKEHGCKSAQGFYYGAPVPAEQLTVMLGEYANQV